MMKTRKISFTFVLKIFLCSTLLLTGSLEATSQSPVAANGKLSVSGTKLVNKNGTAIQLRGMSTHGPQWFKDCYNSTSLDVLVNDWGIDVFRIAMYVEEKGYINNPSYWRSWIDDMVDLCGQKGIYCMIDWHILKPGDPNVRISEAKEFWKYMSNKHKGKDHVLYELCNEPNGVGWSTIKSYANQIIPIIRANDPNTIIIVGTPTWSQDVDIASSDMLNYSNIMYALHFYAGTHTQYLRDKASKAIANGAALFVTEFGTSTASGDGGPYLSETEKWIDFLATNKISWINWSFADKAEVSAALNPGSCGSNYNNTSPSGTFIKQRILNPPDDWGGSGIPVTGVTVTPTSITVSIGGKTQLTATVSPSNATNKSVSWSSNNTAVATVNSSGVVTGVANGSVTITVKTKDGGFTARSGITVSSVNVPVTGVTVSPTTVSVGVGKTTQLTATVSPSNATNKAVSWSSNNTSVATVNSSGVVTGVSKGSATITVKTQDGGYTASCKITVSDGGTGGCNNPMTISIPFAKDGEGEFCWSTTKEMAYVNSWNLEKLTINGTDFTNTWSDKLPSAQNGKWIIHYIGKYSWSHFEAAAAKNAVPMASGTKNGVRIYPNPFKDGLNIELSRSVGAKRIEVINSMGQVVEALDEGQVQRDLINLKIGTGPGLYLIRIYNGKNIVSEMIVKE